METVFYLNISTNNSYTQIISFERDTEVFFLFLLVFLGFFFILGGGG